MWEVTNAIRNDAQSTGNQNQTRLDNLTDRWKKLKAEDKSKTCKNAIEKNDIKVGLLVADHKAEKYDKKDKKTIVQIEVEELESAVKNKIKNRSNVTGYVNGDEIIAASEEGLNVIAIVAHGNYKIPVNLKKYIKQDNGEYNEQDETLYVSGLAAPSDYKVYMSRINPMAQEGDCKAMFAYTYGNLTIPPPSDPMGDVCLYAEKRTTLPRLDYVINCDVLVLATCYGGDMLRYHIPKIRKVSKKVSKPKIVFTNGLINMCAAIRSLKDALRYEKTNETNFAESFVAYYNNYYRLGIIDKSVRGVFGIMEVENEK